jgi:hypothetical protein
MNNESNRDEPHHLVSTTYEDEDEVIHSPPSVTDEGGRSITRPVPSPILQPFHEIKWNRLRQDYNDQYLEIFKHALEPSNGERLDLNLPSTQLGAVCWLPSEKGRLYEILERRGRQDLKAIAQYVKTKSETEVNAYLSWLRQEETDRQLLEAQAKNISHIDIPAAIEIGSECEAVLDKAAAALSAFQEHFDFAAGQRSQGVWLIDRQTASELDKATDEIGLSHNLSEADEESQPLADSARFFHMSTFLSLSESFYMNQGSGETWHDLGEDNERPAMTMDALNDFYKIIVSYLRRLIQSIIFIAKSRIRLTSSISYSTLHTVRQEDVNTALDIMNVNNDLWSYWIQMPRRNKLLVVHRKSVKHFNADDVINYDKVEGALSERRRGRSLSAMSEFSEESGRIDGSFSELADGDEDTVLPEYVDDALGSELDIGDGSSAEEGMGDSGTDEDMSFGNGDDIDNTHIGSPSAVPHPTSKRKRALAMEAETDEYMEHLDQKARVQEESRLLQVLGLEPENVMKEGKIEVSRKRPRVMRKTVTETKGWSAAYQSEWELHKEPVQFSNLQTRDASHSEADLE